MVRIRVVMVCLRSSYFLQSANKKNAFIYKHTKTGFSRRCRVKSRLSNENFDFILRLV